MRTSVNRLRAFGLALAFLPPQATCNRQSLPGIPTLDRNAVAPIWRAFDLHSGFNVTNAAKGTDRHYRFGALELQGAPRGGMETSRVQARLGNVRYRRKARSPLCRSSG